MDRLPCAPTEAPRSPPYTPHLPRQEPRCPGRSCHRRSGGGTCTGRWGRCRKPAGSRFHGARPARAGTANSGLRRVLEGGLPSGLSPTPAVLSEQRLLLRNDITLQPGHTQRTRVWGCVGQGYVVQGCRGSKAQCSHLQHCFPRPESLGTILTPAAEGLEFSRAWRPPFPKRSHLINFLHLLCL